MERLAGRLIELYPRIFLACHAGHGAGSPLRRDLTSRQILILEHMDERQGINLKDLARHIGVTPATMSVSVDRLARRGLVVHQRSARDRREIELRLSAAGAKIMDSGSVLEPGRVARMLELLSESEREIALRGLELLSQAADRLESQSSKWEDTCHASDG